MPKKTARRTGAKADPVEASIVDLKKEVRKKVVRGQSLAKGRKLTNLEAREIQIKIADLETRAAKASTAAKRKNSPSSAQKVVKQTEALKRKLGA